LTQEKNQGQNGTGRIIEKGNQYNLGFEGNGNLSFTMDCSGDIATVGKPINKMRKWHHVSGSFNGKSLSLILNDDRISTQVSGISSARHKYFAIGNTFGRDSAFHGIIGSIELTDGTTTPIKLK
jgi:hypothetical protein